MPVRSQAAARPVAAIRVPSAIASVKIAFSCGSSAMYANACRPVTFSNATSPVRTLHSSSPHARQTASPQNSCARLPIEPGSPVRSSCPPEASA
jgi:hypothetical protein